MKRENIGFDLDGVICNSYPTCFNVLKEMYPDKVKGDNVEYNWEEKFGLSEKQVNNCFVECANRGIFRELPVYPEARKVLQDLANRYNIFIVTWRNYLPNAIADTLYWLDTNSIPYYRMVMTKTKFKVAEKENFKFYLDDNPMFCNRTAKTIVPTFLFRQPWNENAELDPLVKIVNTWEDVKRMLLF